MEKTIHYLLGYQLYSVQQMQPLNDIRKLDSTLQNSSEDQSLTILLHGSEFALNVHKKIKPLTF